MKWLKIFLISLALCLPAHALAQEDHPCGNPGLDFERLTSFFLVKWHADYRDLNQNGVASWKRYHNLGGSGVTIVRLFQSRVQRKVAVLHGKPMPGADGVDTFCIVKMGPSYILTYHMTEIEKILNAEENDI